MSLVEFIFRKAGKVFNFTEDRLHLLVPLGIWENLHSIFFMYTCNKILVYYVLTRSFLLDASVFSDCNWTRTQNHLVLKRTKASVFSLYLFRWRHWEIISDRLLNNISLRSSIISNFSCKRKLHLFELGLYDL